MIEIDGKIVSLDILTEYFCCDIRACRGICCVEGNSGAPLEEDEMHILEKEFPRYRQFMKAEGLDAVGNQGFGIMDLDGDLTTPLIDDAECAYSYVENGITLCAVEKAWQLGLTAFRKPISCHLYPIRVTKFSNGTYGLNYHRWDVCAVARACGKKNGTPVFRALREPLVRAFGQEFYDSLEEAKKYVEKDTRE